MKRLLKSRLAAARREEGFTIIELTAAILVLSIGVLGLVAGFDSSNKLSLVSERHATMSHIAERELERLQGIAYSQLAINSGSPTHSTDPTTPDYYVTNGSPPTLTVDRTGGTNATEPIVIDATNGTVPHFQTETDGTTTYNIYDYITWSQDSACSPSCSGTQNYKRITVAVSVTSGLQPTPVWSVSQKADPASEPAAGISNGNPNNPIQSSTTYCQSGGQTVQCDVGLGGGTGTTYYLHDCAATAGSCSSPSSDHSTSPTAGPVSSLLCSVISLLGITSGCPVPDAMDTNPPSGTTANPPAPTPCHDYSTDLVTGLLCGLQLNSNNSTSCTSNSWSNSLLNIQNHMWVTSPVTASTTLTGDGALSIFSQMANGSAGANAVVNFCIALYDVPPSGGVAGSLLDILIPGSQPTLIGGASYTPPTNPNTSGNWPASAPSSTSFTFRALASPTAVYVLPAGHRLGIRIWVNVSTSAAVDLFFDNLNYPASLTLNSQ